MSGNRSMNSTNADLAHLVALVEEAVGVEGLTADSDFFDAGRAR